MKLFTVEEANALLPFLRETLARMADDRKAIQSLAPEIRRAQERSAAGGGSEYGTLFIELLTKLRGEAERIESLGVLVKDYDIGLCDFPHDRHGQVVFLCWRPDEDSIEWWHEVDAGFAGRQPLD